MKEYLKRIIKLGEITLINSLMPILTWILLGVNTRNANLIKIFSLTYSAQFIPYLLLALFVTGNIVGSKKGKISKDAIYSGIVIANLTALAAIIITTFNIKDVMAFMGTREGINTGWLLYSLWFMYFTVPLTQVLELLYFENKENEAKRISSVFNFLYCVGVNILYVCTKSEPVAASVSLTMLGAYVYFQLFKQFKPFKFMLNVFKGMRYQLSIVGSNLMMFITYLFGMKTVFSFSPDFALAVSFCSMLTDTQWDMIINSVCTVSKVEISKGSYKAKEIMQASRAYVIIIASSIWLILPIGYLFYKPELKYILVIMLFETADILLVQTRYVKQTWVDIEVNTKWSMYLVMGTKIIRMLISASGLSMYCLWIAQMVSGVMNTLGFGILYRYFHKIEP